MNCGSCSRGWCRRRRHGRRAVGGAAAADRLIPAGIIFLAATGCTWRPLPPVFGSSWQTMHRRFAKWGAARVWAKPYPVLLDELGSRGELDRSRGAIDSVGVRAAKPADPLPLRAESRHGRNKGPRQRLCPRRKRWRGAGA